MSRQTKIESTQQPNVVSQADPILTLKTNLSAPTSSPLSTAETLPRVDNLTAALQYKQQQSENPIVTIPENPHTVVQIPTQQDSTDNSSQAGIQSPCMIPIAILDSFLGFLCRIQGVESKLTIVRVSTFCILIAILSFTGILSTEGIIQYKTFTNIIYGYLTFLILENMIRVQCHQRASWNIREDYLSMANALSGIILLTCMWYPSFATLVLVAISCGLPLSIYCFLSKASGLTKAGGIAVRFLYAIQAITVMLKLTHYMEWDWRIVLSATWFLLAVSLPFIIFYSLKSLLQNLLRVLRSFDYLEFYFPDDLKQTCLLLWLLGHNMLAYLVGVYIFGITQVLQRQNAYHFLKIVSIVGLSLSLSLLISARWILTVLSVQTQSHTLILIMESANEEEVHSGEEAASKDIGLTFENLRQNKYFVKSSQCYFMPFTADILLKRQERTPLRSKTAINQQHTDLAGSSDNEVLSQSVILPVTASFCNFERKANDDTALWKQPTKPQNNVFEGENISSNDKDQSQDQTKNNKDSLCYVCCAASSDAVMIPCGHGGVCYQCAEIHVRRKPECMECRAPVDAIAVVKQETGLKGVFRSSRIMKIVKHVGPTPS